MASDDLYEEVLEKKSLLKERRAAEGGGRGDDSVVTPLQDPPAQGKGPLVKISRKARGQRTPSSEMEVAGKVRKAAVIP